MWACQYYTLRKPRTWVSSGGLGTMGFGFPAAIGAQAGRPDALVIDIAGDGSIQMNMQELATAAINDFPVKVVILNNGYLGMVRQWQELFYGKRYASSVLAAGLPDFVKLAEAYGCFGAAGRHARRGRRGAQGGVRLRRSGDRGLPGRAARSASSRWSRRAARIDEMLGGMPGVSGVRDARRRAARGGVGVDEAHTLSAGREQAGRAHARHVAVRSARLQHRLARGGRDRGPDALAHHHRGDRRRTTPLEQITKQLHKLINVIKIQDLDPAESVERELVLFKVNAAPERRHEIIEIANVFRAKIVDVGKNSRDDRGDGRHRQDRGDGGPVPRVRHQGDWRERARSRLRGADGELAR